MATFDQGFNYQIVFEVAGLKGWHLYIDGQQFNDKIQSGSNTFMRVCLHQFEKTKFQLHQYNDGSYYLKVANGQYAGWYLVALDHPKLKNVMNLVVSNQLWADSYWYFDQIKNLGWDNTKIIFRNKYHNKYILAAKTGAWKRNQHSFYAYLNVGNRVSDTWSSFRLQQSGGTSTIQATVDNQQSQIINLKNKCAQLQNDLTYYSNRTTQLQNQLSNTKTSYQNLLSQAESKIQKLTYTNNELQTKINSLSEAKRLYEQFKNQNNQQNQMLKNTIAMLESQKQILIRNREQLQNQISNNNQSSQELYKNLSMEALTKRHQIVLQQWEALIKRHQMLASSAKTMIQQKLKMSAIQAQIYEKQEQNKLLKELIEKMQEKNKQNQQKYKNIIQNLNKEKDLARSQEMKANSRNNILINKINQLKSVADKLRQKTVYFKYLYQQQVGKNTGQGQNEKKQQDQSKQQISNLRQRVQILQQTLRFHEIQLPFNKNDENQQQHQQQKPQETQKQSRKQEQDQQIQEDQFIKGLNLLTAKDRVWKKLLFLKTIDISLMKLDDLDQDFQTLYKTKQQRQANKLKKKNPYEYQWQKQHKFDEKLTNKQLFIDENKIKNKKNDTKARIVFTNQQLSYDCQIAIKIHSVGTLTAIGVYNAKKTLEKDPQNIGKFKPAQHQYYLLSSDGRFAYNDGITNQNQFTNLRFDAGDILTLKFDHITKSISLQIVGKSHQTANFKISFWDQCAFRFVILMQGKGCQIQTAKNAQNFNKKQQMNQQNNNMYNGMGGMMGHSGPYGNSYNPYPNSGQSNQQKQQILGTDDLLVCQNSHYLSKKAITQSQYCTKANNCHMVSQGNCYFCNQCSYKPFMFCEECGETVKQKYKKMKQFGTKCIKCNGDMQLHTELTTMKQCSGCGTYPYNYSSNPSYQCLDCSYTICLNCRQQGKQQN